MRLVSGFFLVLLAAACASHPKDSLVLGLYDVPQAALPEVKAAGFNVVTGPAQSAFLDAAGKSNLKVLAPSRVLSSGASREATLDQLARYDRHPALWGWYLTDEPDMHDLPPPEVDRAARFVQHRSAKPGVVTVASGGAARLYGSECDLLFVDFYPVAWSPVSRFAKEMRLALFARQDRPYMAVLQAFDWSHFADILGQTNGLRLPTISEVRCMAYMALALEAKGLFFYSFRTGTWDITASPLWAGLQELLPELREAHTIFSGAQTWWPYEAEYGDPALMYNEVHEGAILSRLYHVEEAAGRIKPGYYFVLINTTGREVPFDLRVPFPKTRELHHFGSGFPIELEQEWLRWTFGPYEVSIFGPIQESLATFTSD